MRNPKLWAVELGEESYSTRLMRREISTVMRHSSGQKVNSEALDSLRESEEDSK